MTFELVRAGWPNTVAILVLAILPLVTLTVAAERHPTAVQQTKLAAFCPAPAECAMITAAAGPEAIPE
jgi:hypothetical protein